MDIDMPDFTPRNVAKAIANGFVRYKIADVALNLITDHSRFSEDQFVPKMVAGLIGWGVGAQVEPYVNDGVDKTIDFASAKIAERRNNQSEDPKKSE